jgi:hypothetical protein
MYVLNALLNFEYIVNKSVVAKMLANTSPMECNFSIVQDVLRKDKFLKITDPLIVRVYPLPEKLKFPCY